MNKSILTALGAVTLVVTLIGVGSLAAVDPNLLSAPYPPIERDVSQHVDPGFLSQGLIRVYGAYRTDDTPLTVAAWYQIRYHVQPEQSLVQADACIRLEKTDRYRIARQTLVVSLCPSGHGTEVSFNHTLTLGQ